jgi:DNA-binding transcriptional MocR family regulator
MTLSARRDLVRLAREFDALIITDDVYDCLYWPIRASSSHSHDALKAAVPRLVDVDAVLDGGADRSGADGFGNVMSNASFSKIVGPGVRTGWIEGKPFQTQLAFSVAITLTHGKQRRLSSLTLYLRRGQIDLAVRLPVSLEN